MQLKFNRCHVSAGDEPGEVNPVQHRGFNVESAKRVTKGTSKKVQNSQISANVLPSKSTNVTSSFPSQGATGVHSLQYANIHHSANISIGSQFGESQANWLHHMAYPTIPAAQSYVINLGQPSPYMFQYQNPNLSQVSSSKKRPPNFQ
ncbi:hypothetical protein ACP275_04G021300 [Erythranthe tilingii]